MPYSTTVEIEKFEIEGNLRQVRSSSTGVHKAIVIGKGGQSLKRIASEARQDMERLFEGQGLS